MIKNILIVLSLPIMLFSSQQIIVVVSDDMNTSKAKLECFEGAQKRFDTIEVTLGAKGLGEGLGIQNISMQKKLLKYEGDKRSVAGVFKLTTLFGYAKDHNYSMPYLHATKDLICVDDSHSPMYNKIIHKPEVLPESFEWMHREDHQYKLGIFIAHNTQQIKKRGSCIFLHVHKAKGEPTAGCTAMSYTELEKIAQWLDPQKDPILIQVPQEASKEVLKLYPQLRNSTILLKR